MPRQTQATMLRWRCDRCYAFVAAHTVVDDLEWADPDEPHHGKRYFSYGTCPVCGQASPVSQIEHKTRKKVDA